MAVVDFVDLLGLAEFRAVRGNVRHKAFIIFPEIRRWDAVVYKLAWFVGRVSSALAHPRIL